MLYAEMDTISLLYRTIAENVRSAMQEITESARLTLADFASFERMAEKSAPKKIPIVPM